jgi:hypothetical protein
VSRVADNGPSAGYQNPPRFTQCIFCGLLILEALLRIPDGPSDLLSSAAGFNLEFGNPVIRRQQNLAGYRDGLKKHDSTPDLRFERAPAAPSETLRAGQ